MKQIQPQLHYEVASWFPPLDLIPRVLYDAVQKIKKVLFCAFPINIMISMDPKHLFYLSEIIRYGSLSRASQRLGVVQPTLTRVIKILEDQAGAPVLNRGRYGVTPTEIGARLAQTGSDIAHQMERASEAIDQWKSGIGEELRVGVGPMLAVSTMPALLEQYLSGRWPYLLKLTTTTAGGLVNRLNKDELDVALAPAQMNMHQERLVQEVVLEDRMVIYAGRRSRFLGMSTVAAADLSQETWIAVGARSNIHDETGEFFRYLGIDGVVPKLSFTGDAAMCIALLQNTAALVALPERLADASKMLSPAQKLDTDIVMPPRNIAFWTTKEKKDRPQVRHFRQQVTKALGPISKG